MNQSFQAKLRAPFGMLGIRTAHGKLVEIVFLPDSEAQQAPSDSIAEQACIELEAYFSDARHIFDLSCSPAGTPFRRRVWEAISNIPCGATASYGELATRLRTSPRAVGQACGANPLPLVIPCHRVVGKGGIGGFMHDEGDAALAIKRWLLDHESA